MSPRAKNEYLAVMRQRYAKTSSRAKKSMILNEICETCGFHRKHAVRLLRPRNAVRKSPRGKRGRKPTYAGQEFLKPLKKIWLGAHLPCSKRLKAILPLWIPGYEQIEGPLAGEVTQKLLTISASSIDRVLAHTRIEYTGRGRSATKPGTLLRNQIPIATGQWEETRPGFLEGDTVSHCGGNSMGQFAHTLDCVDIATGWTEQRATWGKFETEIRTQMRSIEQALPFPLLGFDSDNGSEFINHCLVRHFLDRHKPVKFTRSRAYRKNDNAHIEQKNWTHVRQWLGYGRFDNQELVDLLNELYTNEWRLFHNFYCPSVKLVSKQRIGSKVIKKHDSPKTPYQRILESAHISEHTKTSLQEIFENTNPFILRKGMEKRMRRIFKLCYNTSASED